METFGDREKCEKLVLKQLIGSEKTGESSQVETDRIQASVSLDPEIEKNLRLRSEIKDTLQGQNRIFVKEFLGNPIEFNLEPTASKPLFIRDRSAVTSQAPNRIWKLGF